MNVIGISPLVHDSAAALLVDDMLVGFAEEERLVGAKHTGAYPERAIDWMLVTAGMSPADVDVVAYGFSRRRAAVGVARAALTSYRVPDSRRRRDRLASYGRVLRNVHAQLERFARAFPGARVVAVPHHDAHAAYAFAASGFDRAAILTVDSIGEYETSTISEAARHWPLRRLLSVSDPHSLGYVWGAVTEHLGWRRGDEEGTVMALAALGDPTRFRHLFETGISATRSAFALDPRLFAPRVFSSRYPRLTEQFVRLTCPARMPGEPLESVHADLAAALQERTVEIFLHLARVAAERSRATNLCLGGGVTLNCLAVGAIITSGVFENVFVPPAPGDSGTAIGAALAAAPPRARSGCRGIVRNAYLGPAYDEPRLLPSPTRHLDGASPAFIAARLAAGEVVGVFRGRLEAGPRALGNRSILASPVPPDMRDRLNDAIKYREPFRPFAPAILAHRVADWFERDVDSPFMSVAIPVRVEKRHLIPGVLHLDGTARLQTVTRGSNPWLFDLLVAFEATTGIPIVVNTSLNVSGKPICGTPEMALACMRESGLDGLLIGDDYYERAADGMSVADAGG